jgi:hypothetical protein
MIQMKNCKNATKTGKSQLLLMRWDKVGGMADGHMIIRTRKLIDDFKGKAGWQVFRQVFQQISPDSQWIKLDHK